MIPIIFDKSEPNKGSSAFTSNGLGRLRDALSCVVTRSLDGSQYDLEMEYPVDGVHFEDVVERNYIYTSVGHKSDPQPFRIVKVSKPINGRVNVTAQHISYILKKTLIRPYLGTTAVESSTRFRIDKGATLSSVLTNLHNYIQPSQNDKFTFTTNVDATAGYAYDPYTKTWYEKTDWGNATNPNTRATCWEITKPISVQEFLTGSDENSINSVFGFKEEDSTQLEYYFDGMSVQLLESVGEDTGIKIRYGKQMTDLTYDTDHEEAYGSCIPYFSGSRTATTIIGPVVTVSGDADDAFGEISMVDLSSDEGYQSYLNHTKAVADPTNAGQWARQKMIDDTVWLSKTNVTVSFIDLWKTEEYKDVAPLQLVDIGDTVTVVHPELDVNVTKRIQNESWDSLVDRYTSMTLGDLRKDIKDVILEDMEIQYGELSKYVEETNTYFSTEFERTEEEIRLNASAISGVESRTSSLEITAGEIVQEVWDSSSTGGTSRIDQTATAITSEVSRATSAESSIISQMPDEIVLTISNNYSTAGIKITLKDSNGNELDSDSGTINMSGLVTFTSLSNSGSTTINGDNITTGTISASRIDVENLTVSRVKTTYDSSLTQVDVYNGYIYWRYQTAPARYVGRINMSSSGLLVYRQDSTSSSVVLDSSNYTNYAADKYHTHTGYLTSHQTISSFSRSGTTITLTLSGGSSSSVTIPAAGISGVKTSNGSSGTEYSGGTHVYTTGLVTSTSTTEVSTNRNSFKLSDARLKENIKPLQDFTKVYMRLEPVEFNYKWYNLPYTDALTYYGIIAQDLQRICDEEGISLYHTALLDPQKPTEGSNEDFYVGKNGRVLTVDKENLHALHIQMIQKQQREIQSLQQEVISLRGEIEIIKQQLKEVIQNGK